MLGAVTLALRPHRSLCRGLSRCWAQSVCQSSSFSSACPLQQGEQGVNPDPRWSFSVSPFSSLRAQLGSSCSLSVSPLDPHAFPSADRAFVSLRGVDRGQEPLIRYDEDSQELSIIGGGGEGTVLLEAPIKTNLFISTEGRGHVHIRKMECDVCRVSTELGDCTLHSVKGHQVEVRSSGGNVTGMGTIHGNVDIVTTGPSAVELKKVQGTRMKVRTELGLLKIKAVYAESSSVCSHSGRVELGHVHGSATVQNGSGDTVIDGSNSLLKVSSQTGNIDVYVGEGGSAHIDSERGAVSVRVPPAVSGGAELSGASVDVEHEVVLTETERTQSSGQTTLTGFINRDSSSVQSQIRVRTSASVSLRTQSWFQSLRLRGP